jgi:hypothetical protein
MLPFDEANEVLSHPISNRTIIEEINGLHLLNIVDTKCDCHIESY